MSENDAQLELKKRARRRLVGAVALAVLAAIVLPMVMDQAPKQPAQDIQIRIPAQDAGAFTSRILPVKPGTMPTPLPPVASEADVQSARPLTPPSKPDSRPSSKPESKSVATRSDAGKSAGLVAKPIEPETSPAADDKQSAMKPEQAKAKSLPASGNGEQWVVQLGAYREQSNVRNLTAKLKQQGYNFFTETLPLQDGVSKTRVRAGPFPSKEAAEKARERIKRIGVDGVVAQK